MADAERPLLGDLGDEISAVTGELGRLASLRWRLAEIELRESARVARRFGLWAASAAVLLLTSLPVFVVAVGNRLDTAWAIKGLSWMWLLGLALAILGAVLGWLAWRRFRRDFRGLEQSIEELREDLLWLQEWTGQKPKG